MKYSFDDALENENDSPPTTSRHPIKELQTTMADIASKATPTKIPFESNVSPMDPVGSPPLGKSMSLVTTRRPRPALYSPGPSQDSSTAPLSSGLTPQAKRHKQNDKEESPNIDQTSEDNFRIEYPDSETIVVPSKGTLKTLLKQAVNNNDADQLRLAPAGILSLQQVLLPAIALQEEAALKKVQSKIQRDVPTHKTTVEEGRRLIRASIRKAMEAVEANCEQRMKIQETRRQEAMERARQQRIAERNERERLRQLDLETRRQEAEKARQERLKGLKLQHNRILYTEIFSLTRSITQLEKENKMWKDVLSKQESSKAHAEDVQEKEDDSQVDGDVKSSTSTSNEASIIQEQTKSTVQDLILSSRRIQQGLAHVLIILKDSEKIRQQLYNEYRRNHHFDGYQGVHNPRDLIRLLSQED